MSQLLEFSVWLSRFIPENTCDPPWVHDLFLNNQAEGQVFDKHACFILKKVQPQGDYMCLPRHFILLSPYILSPSVHKTQMQFVRGELACLHPVIFMHSVSQNNEQVMLCLFPRLQCHGTGIFFLDLR